MTQCEISRKNDLFQVVCDGEPCPVFETKDMEAAQSCMEAIEQGACTFSVWVGGTEVVDYMVPLEDALEIAGAWRQDGYDDVSVSFYQT